MPRCVRALAVVMVCYVMALPATATTDASANAISDICLRAGQTAARRAGVPEPVLLAITLTETGRVMNGRHRPWPWTVNMEGVGKWFDTREEALAYVRAHHARGARSYDVGCFQINYRWHGQAFASIEAMFDPDINAAYAARYLSSLYGEKGTWSKAAGRYHSATPKFATRYRARFDRILARLTGGEVLPATQPAAPVELPPTGPEPVVVAAPGPLADPLPAGPGSLAVIHALPRAGSLLIRPPGSLFGGK